MGDKFRNTIAPTQNNSSASIERRESSSFNVNLVQFVLASSREDVQLSNFLPFPQATRVLQLHCLQFLAGLSIGLNFLFKVRKAATLSYISPSTHFQAFALLVMIYQRSTSHPPENINLIGVFQSQ